MEPSSTSDATIRQSLDSLLDAFGLQDDPAAYSSSLTAHPPRSVRDRTSAKVCRIANQRKLESLPGANREKIRDVMLQASKEDRRASDGRE